MAFKQTLPAPTWSGFEAECLGKFLNFVVKQRLKGDPYNTERIEQRISDLQYEIRGLRRYIEDCARATEKLRSDLEEVETQLARITDIDDEALESMLKSITDLPYVTGLRADEQGALTVRIALRQQWWYTVDLGEVEFSFANVSEDLFLSYLVRKPWSMKGIHLGEYRRSQSGLQRLDTTGDIASIIDDLRREIEGINRRGAWRYPYALRPLRRQPLQFDADVIKAALKNTLLRNARGLVQQQARLKRQLAQNAKDTEDDREAIRGNNTQLRTLRTQLAGLKSGGENIVVNLQEVADELRRIIALPGVMGLRFKKNGTPVFHVRASHLYRGRRYDVGDFEIRFKLFEEGDQGALNVYGTRVRRGNFYYHPEDRAGTSWFCFGSRAKEAQDMFYGGHYAAMMGLLINSLNSINGSDRSAEALSEYYHRIPVDLVWKPALTLGQAELTAATG